MSLVPKSSWSGEADDHEPSLKIKAAAEESLIWIRDKLKALPNVSE